MEENIYDTVVDLLKELKGEVRIELATQFKKSKPFRMTPVSEEEMLYKYNQTTPEEMDGYIQNYGRDAVNDMIYNFEELKRRKGYGRVESQNRINA